MKSISILLFLTVFSGKFIIAQNIGIGTNTPHASAQLEISAANKGLLIPRMNQANRPASPATGLLIYQTNNTPGFYYFDGSNWKGINTTWLENGASIYNGNSGLVGIGVNSPAASLHVSAGNSGGIDGNILITNDFTGHTLFDGLRLRMNNLTGSIQNSENGDLFFQTNQGSPGAYGNPQIFIKPSGAIGLGTSTPGAKLEVAGQVKITGGTPGAGRVLTSDANGLATWAVPVSSTQWATNGNNIYNANTGFVGVGTNTPNHVLQVHNSATTDASIQLTNNWSGSGLNDGLRIRMYNEDDASINNRENGDLGIVTNSGAAGAVGVPMIWIKPDGAVGIGTSTPSSQLEVAGQIKITGGSPGAGKVLTSDASGLATWAAPSANSQWTTNGNNIYNANSGSVGVGVNPSTFVQLHVRRAGAFTAAPGAELGAIYAENGNVSTGSAVYGASSSPRTGANGFAGVTGYNLSSNTDRFGVIGISSGTSAINAPSAGVGGYGDYGVLGNSSSGTGAGVIAQHSSGNNALEINNGFIKVSGTNKTAFTVTGTVGNSSGHILTLSYANQSTTDIVIVTHNYNPGGGGVGNYHNVAVGVYWTGSAWAIYSEDTTTPILGKAFNVLVVRQ